MAARSLCLDPILPSIESFAADVRNKAAAKQAADWQPNSGCLYDNIKIHAMNERCQILSSAFTQACLEMLNTLARQCMREDESLKIQKRICVSFDTIKSHIQECIYSDFVKLAAEEINKNNEIDNSEIDVDFIISQYAILNNVFPQISFEMYSRDVTLQVNMIRRQYLENIEEAVCLLNMKLTPVIFMSNVEKINGLFSYLSQSKIELDLKCVINKNPQCFNLEKRLANCDQQKQLILNEIEACRKELQVTIGQISDCQREDATFEKKGDKINDEKESKQSGTMSAYFVALDDIFEPEVDDSDFNSIYEPEKDILCELQFKERDLQLKITQLANKLLENNRQREFICQFLSCPVDFITPLPKQNPHTELRKQIFMRKLLSPKP